MSQQEPARKHAESLPAWSLAAGGGDQISIGDKWPERVTREWAWGGSTGKGVRVCILDSGVEAGHPLVGEIDQAVAFNRVGDEDEIELMAPIAPWHHVRAMGEDIVATELVLPGGKTLTPVDLGAIAALLGRVADRHLETLHRRIGRGRCRHCGETSAASVSDRAAQEPTRAE